jgi:hypothetical protein
MLLFLGRVAPQAAGRSGEGDPNQVHDHPSLRGAIQGVHFVAAMFVQQRLAWLVVLLRNYGASSAAGNDLPAFLPGVPLEAPKSWVWASQRTRRREQLEVLQLC